MDLKVQDLYAGMAQNLQHRIKTLSSEKRSLVDKVQVIIGLHYYIAQLNFFKRLDAEGFDQWSIKEGHEYDFLDKLPLIHQQEWFRMETYYERALQFLDVIDDLSTERGKAIAMIRAVHAEILPNEISDVTRNIPSAHAPEDLFYMRSRAKTVWKQAQFGMASYLYEQIGMFGMASIMSEMHGDNLKAQTYSNVHYALKSSTKSPQLL